MEWQRKHDTKRRLEIPNPLLLTSFCNSLSAFFIIYIINWTLSYHYMVLLL
jgi:hypothetical protein